jgi:hypothetical protein
MISAVQGAFVLVALTTSAATAYAECAWVLWVRYAKPPSEWTSWPSDSYWETKSRCWRKILDSTSVPEDGSLADLVAWTLGKGIYNKNEHFKFRIANGAALAFPSSGYEYICLPDTVDPRGPKGK